MPSIFSIGQFYTEKNVFSHPAFKLWWNKIPLSNKKKVIEPFAGKNAIVDMLSGYLETQFFSYDITPGRTDVILHDTLKDFPSGFSVGVTNPPFLAKNSATRHQVNIKIDPYQDLYEVCLKKCLDNLDYLAVIIPESFITSPYFKNRLYAVVSLTQKNIFKHTEQPVCLALFVKKETSNYSVYKNEDFLGNIKDIRKIEKSYLKQRKSNYQVLFHEPSGQLGFIATDSTLSKMRLVEGKQIPDKEVNNLARLRLRILVLENKSPLQIDSDFLHRFNTFLASFRRETKDITLTSFKGLRCDGWYRRRMSFSKLKLLMLHFLEYELTSKP